MRVISGRKKVGLLALLPGLFWATMATAMDPEDYQERIRQFQAIYDQHEVYRASGYTPPSGKVADFECGQDSRFVRPGCGTARAEPESPAAIAPLLPQVTLSSSASQQAVGEPIMLSWEVLNADSCVAGGDWVGSKPHAGSNPHQESVVVVGPGVREYTLTCDNGHGLAQTSRVTIEGVAPPQVSITASSSSVPQYTNVTLTWTVSGAESCVASNRWSGSKNPNGGSQSVQVNTTTVSQFVLTCTNAFGVSTQDSVGVRGTSSGGGGTTPACSTAYPQSGNVRSMSVGFSNPSTPTWFAFVQVDFSHFCHVRAPNGFSVGSTAQRWTMPSGHCAVGSNSSNGVGININSAGLSSGDTVTIDCGNTAPRAFVLP